MRDHITRSYRQIGPQPRIEPEQGQADEASAGDRTAKGVQSHVEAGDSTQRNADAEIQATAQAVQRRALGTEP